MHVPLHDRGLQQVHSYCYLIRRGAKVILCSHLGHPEGVTPRYSLKPLVPRLSELIQINVGKANDCIGEEVEKLVAGIPDGGVLLLEKRELDYLVGAMTSPRFVAIVCGSKLSSEIGVIESLLGKVDALIIGGQMAFTFMRALNHSVGTSPVEEDKHDLAKSLVWRALARKVDFVLTTDVIVADKFALDANSKTVLAFAIPEGWMGLDIGPITIDRCNGCLDKAKTVLWYGTIGVFGMEKFDLGTEAIAKKLAELNGKGVTTIVGGDDLIATVKKLGLADKISHILPRGDAYKELLEGKSLPGICALDDTSAYYL
ncbi:hypothetical protein MKX01_002955 [Papaver californicum]|nr:hypothetical protein MKX01_002955 [Papaver californicum]